MRVHYLQHVPFETLGSIEPWLKAAGCPITGTLLFESAQLPETFDFDLLIVMGGPMSVNDETLYPWLADEKEFIRKAIASGKAVLGICLGAQLIAAALGAHVYPNRHREIGWFPVQGLASTDSFVFKFPSALNVFHWHGETFDLPCGAIHLAGSEACENQAFQIGNSVMGLQFHLETTPASVKTMVFNCGNELIPSDYVQTEREILAADVEQYYSINQMMGKVLAFLQNSIAQC